MLMCMRMLNKRVHILFEKEMFKLLRMLAKEQGKSVGELIRNAVRKFYFNSNGKLKKKL